MTPALYEQLVETLKRGPLPLERLHAYAADAGSTWSMDQLHLMLDCLEGVRVEPGEDGGWKVRLGQQTQQEELADAIVEVVRSQGGKPLPAMKVLELLPPRFTTSVEQIRKIARESKELHLIGPGLISFHSH